MDNSYNRYTDKNGKILKSGDIFDIHQTVNGQSEFVLYGINPLDVRYFYDQSRFYEYSVEGLLKPFGYTGEVDWEIIGSLYNIKET